LEVGLKARPLCAGVSVSTTMRLLRRKVYVRYETYILTPCLALSFADATSVRYLENAFRSFHEGICLMTTETQKPVAPGTTKVEPAVTPTPQQNQGDAKPSADKPAGQQQK
jgi:hypothetical protein